MSLFTLCFTPVVSHADAYPAQEGRDPSSGAQVGPAEGEEGALRFKDSSQGSSSEQQSRQKIAAAADARFMCEKQQPAGVQTASELHPSRVDNNITMGAAI
jgi:hypothetical protein